MKRKLKSVSGFCETDLRHPFQKKTRKKAKTDLKIRFSILWNGIDEALRLSPCVGAIPSPPLIPLLSSQPIKQASIFGSRFLFDALPGFCIPARIQGEDGSHGVGPGKTSSSSPNSHHRPQTWTTQCTHHLCLLQISWTHHPLSRKPNNNKPRCSSNSSNARNFCSSYVNNSSTECLLSINSRGKYFEGCSGEGGEEPGGKDWTVAAAVKGGAAGMVDAAGELVG